MDPHPAGDTTAEPLGSGPTPETPTATAHQFRDRFESLLPSIQKEWPEVARHTLEATRGSFDTVV